LDCEDNSLRITLNLLLAELKDIRKKVLEATAAVRKVAATKVYKEDIELLRSICRIGPTNAMVIRTELGNTSRFKCFYHLCSYVGFIPSTDDSGDNKATRVTHRCNNRLRTALIESSWMLISKDPAMLMKYSAYCKRMDKNKAILRIGKHLLSRIKYVLTKREKYEPCVV
jgi:transposase